MARMLQESSYISIDDSPLEQGSENEMWLTQQHLAVQDVKKLAFILVKAVHGPLVVGVRKKHCINHQSM